MNEQLIDSAEVIRRLNISKPTLYRYIRHHGFPEGNRLAGGPRSWRSSEVNAWIAEKFGAKVAQ